MATAASVRTAAAAPRAIEAEGVRAALRRRGVGRGLALLLGIAVLGAATVGILEHRRGEDALARHGVEVTGRVVATGAGRVTVVFERGGRSKTFTANLSGSGPRFRVGQRILVLVDPQDLDRHRVKGQASPTDWTPILLGAVALSGAVLALIGAVGLARGRREARLLRSGSWRRVGLRTARRAALPGLGRSVILVNESGREHVLGVMSTGLGHGTMRNLHGRDRAEIVGDPRRRIVVRPEGGMGFVSARTAPTAALDRRWRLALGAPPRR